MQLPLKPCRVLSRKRLRKSLRKPEEKLRQSELMAGGQVPLVGGQVPYSQLFAPSGMQTIPFLPVDEQWVCVWSFDESWNEFDVSRRFSDSDESCFRWRLWW